MKQEMRYSVVRRGTSLVLAATLATGMVPAIALAQDAGSNGATPVVQADEGFTPVEGKTYSVPVTWAAMASRYFSPSADATYRDGKWNVDLVLNDPSVVGDVSYDGKKLEVVNQTDSEKVYRLVVDSLDDPISLTMVIIPMQMFMPNVSVSVTFDTSGLGNDDVVSYESGFNLYYKGAKYDGTSRSFEDKVKVTPADGVYNVELTAFSLAQMGGELGDVTYDGKAVAKVTNEDGSVTYTLPLPSVDGTYDFTFSYTFGENHQTHSWPFQLVLDGGTYSGGSTKPEPGQGEQQVDKTALNAAIAKAKAIKQGNKTDQAFAALQEAIATAEKAAANDKIPQAGVNAATEQLNAAIEKFGTSADKPSNSKADFKLEQGKEYTVPAKLVKADGSDSMAAQYFEQNATVVWDGAHYKVRFGITAAGAEYIKGVSHAGADATSLGSNQYEVTVGSLAEAIELTFGLSTPMGDMQQTAYLSLDTTSLPTTSGEPIKPSNPSDNTGNNGGNNSGTTTTDPAGQRAEQGFQVGHTYQVPVSWLKQNSSETSMAAKYFGDTALVRPQSDGTFKVSFSATSEGASHIISLAYNGSTLAKSGNQYTVSIPKADSDTVVPISMTIKEMEQLGGGAQVADMHLKLSQAKDLGTGQDSVVASSSTTMAQTGDVAAGVAGAAAVAALVAGGVAVASRRRSKRQ